MAFDGTGKRGIWRDWKAWHLAGQLTGQESVAFDGTGKRGILAGQLTGQESVAFDGTGKRGI